VKLYILVGEPSGDLHASNLMKSLSARLPGLQYRGMGGDLMVSAGLELVKHIRETNFMGFVEVLANLPKILGLFKLIKADILANRPDAILLVDYPGFNLRMAKFAAKQNIPVFYYISPQVWAWKAKRVFTVQRYVRRMMTILPFEAPFYAKYGIKVDYVGHPLLDAVRAFQVDASKLATDDSRPIIALLPGSRRQELTKVLPMMVGGLSKITNISSYRLVLAVAPTMEEAFVRSLLAPFDLPIELVHNQTYDLLNKAQFALVTSGTATLETALFQVPQVVCYRGNAGSIWLAKRLVNIKYISLVNLILDKELVTELIQADCFDERIAFELNRLIQDDQFRNKMISGYQELRTLLGSGSASEKAADIIRGELELISHKSPSDRKS
jgi:lipid-A-disaccharide synthase